MINELVRRACTWALAAALAACAVDVGDDRPPLLVEPGALSLLWTVAGTLDPEACFAYARAPELGMDLELRLFDLRLGLVEVLVAPCEDFALYVDLRPGDYDAEVTMIDPTTSAALSTTAWLYDIRVIQRTVVEIDLDFPPRSFFYPPVY